MGRQFFVFSMVVVLGTVGTGSLEAEVAKPRIASWSNSKTENRDTFFLVKPGEKITFTVKAEGGHSHEWKIDTKNRKGPLGPVGSGYRRRSKQYKWREYEVRKAATGESFTWTVPDRKGLWKIQVRAISRGHERHTQNVISNCAKYWKKDKKEEWAEWMKDALTPSQARAEWIVSTSLVKVKPGESIAKAIDSLPAAGGIVKLLPGTHVVKKTITIKRNNLAIVGPRSAVVRHDPPRKRGQRCFDIPRGGYHDITFKGFSTVREYSSSYCSIIMADEVINLTVENMNDTSQSGKFVCVHSNQQAPRFSRNIFFRDNITYNGADLCAMYSENVHFVHNTVKKGGCACINVNRNLTYTFVYDNYASNATNSCLRGHGAIYAHIYNNTFVGGQTGVYNDGLAYSIIENNTITGATRFGGIYISPQSPRIGNIYRNNRIYNCIRGVYTDHYKRSAYDDEYRRKHYPPGFRPKMSDPRVINNVIYNCRGDGICMTSPWVRLNISNNIITNNGGYGINYVETREPTVIRNNNIWQNKKGKYNGKVTAIGDISTDPLFANPSKADFHLMSKAGRWDTKAKKWVKDKSHSPCIDAGDPKADFSKEPAPNGGRVNVGAYGNTAEASKSIKK